MADRRRSFPQATPQPVALVLAAYDRQRVVEMLRDWTPHQLLQQLRAGVFERHLSAAEVAELLALLHEWQQRALGMVMLRDALLVDRQRGERVYSLICRAHTMQSLELPAAYDASAIQTETVLAANQVRAAIPQPAHNTHSGALHALLDQAEAYGWALTCSARVPFQYPWPDELETLLPPPPAPYVEPAARFEPPTGWRRNIALALVLLGVSILGIPLLLGQMPSQPAALPLGLLTLALLIGIRAGWVGYIGAFFIWLVPNLPEFHYGTSLFSFLHAMPLLLIGIVLFAFDRRVRSLWRWLRWRTREQA